MNQNREKEWLKDSKVQMIIEIGKTEKRADEILHQWRKGTTIKLEDSVLNLLRVYINNHYFAYGDILRNVDGEMNLQIEKILLDERGIKNVSKDSDL